MRLDGSCHCRAVKFSVTSHTPYPYMRCYCSICRKTEGGGGYAINIMGEAQTLKLTARSTCRSTGRATRNPARRAGASRRRGGISAAVRQRALGRRSRWPDWVYPFASAIDTPLPRPPEDVELMLNYAAKWADVPSGRGHTHFREYPREGIADWHARRGLTVP